MLPDDSPRGCELIDRRLDLGLELHDDIKRSLERKLRGTTL